ncbi:hypothetical protein D3C85_333690 [compost metagenome]
MTIQNSAFDLNNITLNIDLRTNELIATYGDLKSNYQLVEFANDHDAPLGQISIVSLMMAARVRFAAESLQAAA